MKRHKPEHPTAHHHAAHHDTRRPDGTVSTSPSPEVISTDTLKEGLDVIYGEDRADLHVVERGKSPVTRWLTRIVLGLAVATAVAFASFFVYTTFFASDTNEESLTMNFEVPAELVSGEVATIVLHYADPTNVPLASLEIDINLPTTFQLTLAEPAPTDPSTLVWDLGSLPENSDGKITLTGVWVADVPSTTSLQALANFKPANFNAYFHEITTASINTSASTASVVLVGPESASPGVNATYTATVSNSGTETLTGTELELALPAGFFVTTSAPALEAGGSTAWTIGDLAPGAALTYVVSGAFASDVSGDVNVVANLGVSDGARVIAQSTSAVSTKVTGSALQLDMVVNGATGNAAADPGSQLRISLRIQNTGDTAITDASALLDFQSDHALPIVWSGATLDGGRVTAAGIVFDHATIGELDPGERELFNLAISLASDVSAEAASFSLVFGASSAGVTVQASPVTVSLNSDAALSVSSRYFDDEGAPLGSGPLPPEVDTTTSYRIFWTVTNGLHSLEDVEVSTTLPEGVTWDNFSNADLGTIAYDASTRTVRLTIAALPDDVSAVSANFSVSVTPTSDDEGAFMTLTSGTTMRATDVETGSSIERKADGVTTELAGDAFAEGKGVVVDD